MPLSDAGFVHCLFSQHAAFVHTGQEAGTLGERHQGFSTCSMFLFRSGFECLAGEDFRLAVISSGALDFSQTGESPTDPGRIVLAVKAIRACSYAAVGVGGIS